MDKNERYIKDLFKLVGTDCILIVDQQGSLRRLLCPFNVLVIGCHPLKEGQVKDVIAVKISPDLVDVYIIEAKAYYHYNFQIVG